MSDQRVIIFDSPDGTGKTNIAKSFALRHKVPYFKFNREHDYWRKGMFKTALEFDQTYLLQLLQQTRLDVIIDRAWPSEWVYSKVFRRETNISLLKELDEEYSKLGAWIVVPLRDDYSENRLDEVVPSQRLDELHDVYNEFCEWTQCNTLRIYVDSYGNNLNDEITAIEFGLNLDEASGDCHRKELILRSRNPGKCSDELFNV